MKELEKLLKKMVEEGASDLHITVGTPPQMRVDEVLVPMEETALTSEKTKDIIYSILSEAQIKKFERDKELDLSFGIEGLSRFRANVFYQKGHVAGAFRAIPYKIMSFEELESLEETAEILSVSGAFERIKKGEAEAKKGKGIALSKLK